MSLSFPLSRKLLTRFQEVTASWEVELWEVGAGRWVIHRGGKSGCKLVTLFGGYSYNGMSAGIWVILTGPKSGCKLVTLFGGYSYDGVSAGIWVIHTGPKSGGSR